MKQPAKKNAAGKRITKKAGAKKKAPAKRKAAGRAAQAPAAFADLAAAKRFATAVHRRLAAHFGPADTPLTYDKAHELCIAVILSAQCTDEQVNRTTPALFRRFPEPADYARAPLSEIEQLIYSTGFYKNKAKSIQGFCRVLLEEHEGQVPNDAELLRKMPGVGRKTANVIQQELFGVASGVVVDTHVARISRKVFGLTAHTDPEKIEKDLMAVVDPRHWREWSLYLIFLGRYSCTARKRECGICPLRDICPSAGI